MAYFKVNVGERFTAYTKKGECRNTFKVTGKCGKPCHFQFKFVVILVIVNAL